MTLLWLVLLVAAAAAFISRPFFGTAATAIEDPEVAALEAARDAKYREIKDAEIDYRSGKLTRADFEQVDRELRREAVNILNRLERAYAGEKPRVSAREAVPAPPAGPNS